MQCLSASSGRRPASEATDPRIRPPPVVTAQRLQGSRASEVGKLPKSQQLAVVLAVSTGHVVPVMFHDKALFARKCLIQREPGRVGRNFLFKPVGFTPRHVQGKIPRCRPPPGRSSRQIGDLAAAPPGAPDGGPGTVGFQIQGCGLLAPLQPPLISLELLPARQPQYAGGHPRTPGRLTRSAASATTSDR